MSLQQRNERTGRAELQSAGWDITKRDAIAFNAGSETPEHKLCKLAVADVLHDRGYRIDSEVEMGEGEVDIVGYANPDRINPIAVECETNPDDETVDDKLSRYWENEPIAECYILPVEEMPTGIHEAITWAESEL